MDPSSSYRDLYYEWERGQWTTASLPLDADAEGWRVLDDGLRAEVERVIATGASVAGASVDLLVPVVDAAPTEEQQVFLTTQLVDVARHAVLFDLSCSALGLVGERLEASVDPDVAGTIEGRLRALTGRLHAAPDDTALFAETLDLYSSEVAAPLARMRSSLIARLTEADVLPGLRAGLSVVARDVERHAAFAAKVLTDLRAGGD